MPFLKCSGFTFTFILSLLCFFLLGPGLIMHTTAQDANTTVVGKSGRLTGIVRDENNQSLAGATITLEKQKRGTSTSVSGDYVLTLAPGNYTILVSMVGFTTKRISEVIIKQNEQTDLSITLTRAKANTLGDVVVTSTARRESTRGLLQAQKNMASMSDGVSSEQMTRTPDANAAQALKRVSGVTVQGEKFITIRGVSDRYNNVMINGSALPSTEPNRRNFSFDVVPSALIDNIIVNKTASPDLPGEFTGGVVQINTKDVPVKNFLDIAIATGFNTESINTDFESFKRDDKASIGKVNADRKWYGDGRLLDPQQYLKSFINSDSVALRNIGKQIPNRWQKYKYGYMPVQSYQVSGGLSKRFENSNAIGVVAAVTYLNEQLSEKGEARSLQVFEGTSLRNRYSTMIGGLLNAAYKTKRHKIGLKNLYNLRYNDQFDVRDVTNINVGGPQERLSDVIIASKMWQTRLEAEHLLTTRNIKVEWFADYVKFNREQPDSRFLVASLQGGDLKTYNFNEALLQWGGVYSSVLTEKRNNLGLNVSLPFFVNKEKQLLKVGYSFSNREADFDAASFRIKNSSNASGFSASQQGLPYYEIATQENIGAGNLVYYPAYVNSQSTGDKYNGTQKLHALYAMIDAKLFSKLRITGGVRNENNRMEVKTVFYEQLINPPAVKLVDSTKVYPENDWLPSVNVIYSINNKMNVRGAFSKTLARPDFIERSTFIYYDFPEQLEVSGDKGLEITRIKNYDLRYEFYPSGGEVMSASLFYKKFDKPVERFFIIGNPSNTVEYRNLYSATAQGFEFDIRKTLEFIRPSSSILKLITVSANYTRLSGKISYAVTRKEGTAVTAPEDTFYISNAKRAIQGLSPYIFNAGISFQKTRWGLNIAFNRSGRKIVNGGTNASIVQFENPRSILDFQANAKFFKEKMELRFNISDILNQPFIIYSNNLNKDTNGGYAPEAPNEDPKGDGFNEDVDYINYKVKRGTGFSLKVIYKF